MDLKHLINLVLPPRDPSPEALEAWRLGVFASIVVLSVLFGAHAIWSMGHFSEDTGYVTRGAARDRAAQVDSALDRISNQLEEQVEKVDQAEARRLESEIRNLRAEQCEAIRDKNRDAIRSITQIMEERKTAYYEHTDREYPIPTCLETGVRFE